MVGSDPATVKRLACFSRHKLPGTSLAQRQDRCNPLIPKGRPTPR